MKTANGEATVGKRGPQSFLTKQEGRKDILPSIVYVVWGYHNMSVSTI